MTYLSQWNPKPAHAAAAPPKKREPEPWELHTGWHWTLRGGVWHVVTDLVLSVDGDYRAYTMCNREPFEPWRTEYTTGFWLRENDPQRGFCRECRTQIGTRLLKWEMIQPSDLHAGKKRQEPSHG